MSMKARKTMRVVRWLFPAVAYALLSRVPLDAHAELLRSDPASGSVLSTAPQQVKLWFSEPIEPVPDSITVKTATGPRVDRGAASVSSDDRSVLETRVEIAAPGTYVVEWRAISADSHPINGSFTFSIGAPESTAIAPVKPESNQTRTILQIGGRWFHLLAAAILTGPLVVLVLLRTDDSRDLTKRLAQFARAGALLALPAALMMLIAQTTSVTDSVSAALRPATLVAILRTSWGTLWLVRTLTVVALVALTQRMCRTTHSVPSSQRSSVVALSGVAVLLFTTALNGHSAATAPIFVSLSVDWIHLAATTVWVGGLLTLSMAVLPWTVSTPAANHNVLVRLVSRFSTLALVCVELLILTGLYHTWAHLSGPEAFVTTAYGRVLLLKLGVIGLAMVPAGVNLWIVKPRLVQVQAEKSPQFRFWSERLSWMVATETLLTILVLGAAAALTSLPGMRTSAETMKVAQAPAAPPRETTFAANAGARYFRLRVVSGDVGSNRVHLQRSGDDDKATTGALKFRISPPDGSALSPWTVTPAIERDGFAATMDFPVAGTWTVQVQRTGQTEISFSFPIPLVGASEMLALADRATNSLRSVVEETVETTAAGTTRSQTEYVAPDRAHRRSDGLEEILIGDTRYTHHETMWHSAHAGLLRWPASALAENARDVLILEPEKVADQKCIVVQFTDRATAQHRLWISINEWQVLQHSIVSPGRTTLLRYSRFNSAIAINRPPLS